MNNKKIQIGQTITEKSDASRRSKYTVTAINNEYIVAVGYDCGAFRIYPQDLSRYE